MSRNWSSSGKASTSTKESTLGHQSSSAPSTSACSLLTTVLRLIATNCKSPTTSTATCTPTVQHSRCARNARARTRIEKINCFLSIRQRYSPISSVKCLPSTMNCWIWLPSSSESSGNTRSWEAASKSAERNCPSSYLSAHLDPNRPWLHQDERSQNLPLNPEKTLRGLKPSRDNGPDFLGEGAGAQKHQEVTWGLLHHPHLPVLEKLRGTYPKQHCTKIGERGGALCEVC